MKRSYLRRHTPALFALLLVASTAASAQETAPTVDLRSRLGGQIGFVVYGTGNDKNCPEGTGFTFGAEARTKGVWLGALSVDFFYTEDFLCTLALPHVFYRGESVGVWGTTRLDGAPRLRARVGRILTIGMVHVEPAFGLGMTYGTTDFRYPPPAFWNAWVGGSVTLRPSDSPLGLELEYGVHQVRRSYQAWQSREVVREFTRWEPLFRISLVR